MIPLRLALLMVGSLVAAGCTDLNAGTADPLQPNAGGAAAAAGFGPVLALRQALDLAAAAGTPLNLSASPEEDLRGRGALGALREFPVVLRPSIILNESTWAEVDGVRVPLPSDLRVYEGEIEGRPDSVVRLTVTNDWARGNIRVADTQFLVRLGLHGNLPYAADLGAAPSNPNASAPSNGSMGHAWEEPPLTFYDPNGFEGHDCLRAVPSDVTPMFDPLPGPADVEALTARIVLDADAQFLEQTGRHAFPLMVAFLAEVDGIYHHEVGIRFQVVGVHGNTDPEYYPDPVNEEAPLGKMADHWNARPDVARDVVHLFTGQTSNYAQANCIGGAGQPEIAYTFTPLNWARSYVVFHEQAFAHELGHIFSAHHHYGNHAEASWSASRPAGAVPLDTSPQAGLATIMIQGYTPGAKPVFGTVEKSVIRGWAEKHLGAHDPS